MTASEFNVEFGILYDGVSSGMAPSLNLYEKSLYLTLAQEEIVKEAYSGRNPSKEGLEETEKRRKQLDQLVKNYRNTNPINDSNNSIVTGTDFYSRFFQIPDDLWFTLYEEVVYNSQSCGSKSTWVMVVSHNDYSLSLSNPFRRPDSKKSWRLDFSNLTVNNVVIRVAEIISKYVPSAYHIRYLKRPRPIILLEDLNDIEQGLTINGYNTWLSETNPCELNEVIHRDLLKRAVELAYRDYKEKNLSTLIQTNQRGE